MGSCWGCSPRWGSDWCFPRVEMLPTSSTGRPRLPSQCCSSFYGTRLEPREALEGLKHWKLHTTVLAATYVLFPLLGLAMRLLVPSVLTDDLYTGVLYLCLLPSTVQSSIAFTSIARGNVAAAVVSASVSNMLGVFMTPVLVMLLMQTTGEATVSPTAILEIVVQLLLPFVAGQVLRPKLYRVLSHTTLTKVVDRGSVYLVVYAAFSAGMVEHVWQGLQISRLLAVVGVSVGLLAVVLGVTAGRRDCCASTGPTALW